MGMLVIEREIRKVKDTFLIGEGADTVNVRVLSIRGNKVKFGVTAPKLIRVDRMEVRMQREREASVTPADLAADA